MAFRGALNHLDLTVTDYQRSAPFYERLLTSLGFRRIEGSSEPVWSMRYPSGASWNIALQLARPESREKRHDRYAPGLHHIAFHAESRDDVDGIHQLMRDGGATVLDAPADYGGRGYSPGYYAVFFADPDGIKVEVVHEPKNNP
jgi:glyoxylase I family protein